MFGLMAPSGTICWFSRITSEALNMSALTARLSLRPPVERNDMLIKRGPASYSILFFTSHSSLDSPKCPSPLFALTVTNLNEREHLFWKSWLYTSVISFKCVWLCIGIIHFPCLNTLSVELVRSRVAQERSSYGYEEVRDLLGLTNIGHWCST